MRAYKIICSAIVLSSLLFTSCEKSAFSPEIGPDVSKANSSTLNLNESFGHGVLSSIIIQLEASLSVEQYGCPSGNRMEAIPKSEYRPNECPVYYVATGLAYGLTEEFGHIKAEVTIKYEVLTDEITGQIVLHLASTDEILSVSFRGWMSSSNNGSDMYRFHGLSSHIFLDRYFTGFFSIQNLDQLLKSQGQKNIPIIVEGVME